MTARNSGGSSGVTTTAAPLGPPAAATGAQHQSPPWRPGSNPPLAEEDTLLLLAPTDENQVLGEGGRLATATQSYFSATRAVLGTGPYVSKSFPEDTTGSAHAIYPLDGCLPNDEFTVEFWAKSKGADFRSQTTNPFLLALVDESSALLRLSGTASNGQISCRFVDKTGTPGAEAVATLLANDWPADTWKCFTITLKSGTLKVMLGDNVRSGTASVTNPVSVWGATISNGNAGVMPNGGPQGQVTGPYEISDLHIRRFARTYNTEQGYKGPTVTVDASTSQGAFPTGMFGVCAQYPGWRDALIDGQTGGGGPGVTGTAIRTALIAAESASGAKLARIDHVFDKIGITGSNPYTYDWTNLDNQMDALAAAGFKFHITLGYCPSVLGASQAAVPSSSANFAQMCSDAMSHWITTKGYTVNSISLWNEPEGSNFWLGTTTQYTTLWGAVQAKLATDWPAYPLGGPDTSSKVATASGSGYQKALIDYAALNSLPIGNICTHAYTTSPGVLAAEVAAIRAYLISKGITNASTVPIGLTEYNLDLNIGNQRHDNGGSSNATIFKLRNQYRDEFQPAFLHAALNAVLAAGASFAAYTRMGILDAFYGSSERELGMFTNDSPPRPLPVYAAFQALWKHSGNRVSATTNFPFLWSLASKATTGNIIVTYANFRPWNGSQRKNISFEWTGLPSTFKWKQYRMDSRDVADGRLRLIATGDQTDPPLGADLNALGVGCIEITV